MNEYRVTFGVQYPREPHPAGAWVNGNGWMAVHAPDEWTARALATAVLGTVGENGPANYAFIYGPNDPSRPTTAHYPLGEIACIDFTIEETP